MNKPENNNSAPRLPKSNGMTVPEGYFADFNRRMMEQIPREVPVAETPRRSRWQILRPYVYMAAMFAGIYLMLNIFSFTAGLRSDSDRTAAPLLAEVVNTGTVGYVDEYLEVNSFDLYNDLYESGYEIPDNL